MGKKEIGQMQPFEFVISIMIADIASMPLTDTGVPILHGVIPILGVLMMYIIITICNISSITLREIICGRPTILINKGVLDEANLIKEKITINELQERLRVKDVFSIADVEYAILETNGELSVIEKIDKRNLTPNDLNVIYDIGIEEHDKEGRVITLEFDKFYMVNCYTPNSKRELERLEYRQIWEDEIRKYLLKLNKTKPVIICGDLNVAHKEIDLKNPSTNRRSAGFTYEERNKMTELLDSGFIDTYRNLYPDKENAYTWWSYMRNAREKDIGWRIDYFIVSEEIKDKIKQAEIYSDIYGSDHCPVGLEIDI